MTMRSRRRAFLAQMVAASFAAAFVVATTAGARADDKLIKIGALLPISGPGSYFGVQDKQGV